MGSAFHQLCPRYSGTLSPTAPTAIRQWETFPFYLLNWLIRNIRKWATIKHEPGRVAQSVGHLTRKSGVPGSIPGLATYFRFSFRFFKKGSCQLLAKVCARSTG